MGEGKGKNAIQKGESYSRLSKPEQDGKIFTPQADCSP